MSAGWMLLLGVLGGLSLVLGFQQFASWSASRRVGQPVPALPEATRPEFIGDVVLWFHTPDCAPCRAMRPALDPWIQEGTVREVDASVRPEIAMAFGVMATPTLIRVRNGHIAAVHTGGMSAGALAEWLGAV